MFPPKDWWFYTKIAKEKKNVFLIRNSLALTSATMNLYQRKILTKVNSIKINEGNTQAYCDNFFFLTYARPSDFGEAKEYKENREAGIWLFDF